MLPKLSAGVEAFLPKLRWWVSLPSGLETILSKGPGFFALLIEY